jgi:hypothetical protein
MRPAPSAVAALAAAALIVPSASARMPADEPASTTAYPAVVAPASSTADTPAPTVTQTIADEGFDWGDAAIGAGAAGAVLLLTAAGATAVGHRRHQGVAH